jgi:hypothetical protein
MPIIAGTTRPKTWVGHYDFAVDGGAQSTITLRSNDGAIPAGSYVVGGVLDVITQLNSGGSATAALQVQSANDTVNAAAFDGAPWSTTGQKDIIPDNTGSTAIELTADRSPALVIGAAALTAGKFKLVLLYV